MPGFHQGLLQIRQRDAQHRLLGIGRAQARLVVLAPGDVLGQARGMGPQQQFGKVVQQRGLVDHAGVVVIAVHRKAHREVRRPVAAAQHPAHAFQCERVTHQRGLDHRLGLESPEEGGDAQHDQRLDSGFGIGLVAPGAQRGHMAQQLEHHQRVIRHGLGQQVGVGQVLVLGQVLQGGLGGGQHRNVAAVKGGSPAGHVGQGPLDERRWQRCRPGVRLVHGIPWRGASPRLSAGRVPA